MNKIIAERYELLDVIGRGGMADVYLANDTILNRTIAIKILRTSLAKDPVYIARFQREASAAAALSHKNIVEIYDEYGEKYTWKQYYDKVYNHSQCKPKPFKWVYEIDPLFKNNKPALHVVPCTECIHDI